MTVMMSKLYAALRAAEVPEDKAAAAAEEVAAYENKFGKIEGDLVLLKWMIVFNLTMTVAIVTKLFLSH